MTLLKFNPSYIQISVAVSVSAVLFSCGTEKLPKDDKLYTGAKINIINDTISKREKSDLKDGLDKNLTPKPNGSILGLRPRVWIYNLTPEPKKEKGITNWLKNKVGQKPVVLNEVDRDFNKKIIENYSKNKGYFNAKASYDTIVKGKTAKVVYDVKTGARYLISDVKFPEDSTKLNRQIQLVKDRSLLKKGQPFDLDVIKAERERIDNRMKENGFYYFHPDNLIVQADSTVSKKPEVELSVKVKDNTPELAKKQFSIDNVIVYADYNLRDVKENRYKIPTKLDSVQAYKDFYYIDPKKKFRPIMFERALYFKKGDIYNRADHNLTLNRLISLGVFKFVKNEFVISDSLKNKFDAYYLLTPKEFQSLRFEVLGKTNSANYAGSELNLNWTHRNFFRGAEQFKASVFGSFDVQMGGRKSGDYEKGEGNVYRAGANAQLSVPRLIAPFNFRSSSAFVPRTNAEIGYEYVSRSKWYTLHNFNASFGYSWKENVRKEHDLKIFDATYVFPQKITPKYDSILNERPYLKHSVEKQLIFGPTYAYTYTTTMLPKSNTMYYRGFVDLAGNLSGLLSGANAKDGKEKKIFGVPFSQYAKMENDFRFYHKFSTKQSVATRVIAGIAYPYGNSTTVPFSRQFFAGGSNSIRAFRARTLGPGSYDPRTEKNQIYFDQAGDIKLEANLEYRANIYRFLNVGVFADAGNVWLVNEDSTRPGAKFSKDWLSEVAVGAGFGLRLDFNILLLRLDLAMPIRVPYYQKNDRWMFDKIEFGDKDWRRQNMVLNIAIGYPF